ASLYRETFEVQGSTKDSLIASGTFSLWAPGASTASSIAEEVEMFWTIDTLHHAELVTRSLGPQQELLSINKMSATIPDRARLNVYTTTNDVIVKSMRGDIDITGAGSNITFTTLGRITLRSASGTIIGSTGLGGTAVTGEGNIDLTVTSVGFESIYAVDTTGNVFLKLPKGAPVTFHLQTGGGNINLNYDGVRQSAVTAISTTANGGGKVVTITTGTGDITVTN
ncbi:MAG: DUF4097 family beta strand repeat-containing protein, partial [Ignavibacteriota bacterium]